MRKHVFFCIAAAAALFLAAGSLNAGTISGAEAAGSGVVTLDQNPVVTEILSQPGTFNGKTYTSWSFMVNDGTGSAVVYGTLAGLGYTPTVGDAITAAGTWSPYHQIPEMGTITAISATSSGNAIPAPLDKTIPQVNLSTLTNDIAGYPITLHGVTISGISGTFGVANLTGTITDGGSNSMTFYYWPTSYSVSNANLFGKAIPTGPVDVTGFVSVYNSVAEFTPLTVTPEPATLSLLAIGGIAALVRRRRARA